MKKIFAVAVAVLMLAASAACLFVSAEETTAEPEAEPIIEYNEETKALKISGVTDIPSKVLDDVDWADEVVSLEIAEGVRSIDGWAFANMTSLEKISLPSGIESIGPSAFYNTYFYNLAKNRNEGVLYIEAAGGEKHLIDAIGLTDSTYAVEEGTVCIADSAFADCTSLKAIILREGVKYIGRDAFENCRQLRRLELPESLVLIRDNATYNCPDLVTVAYAGTPADFASISIRSGNEFLRSATLKCAKEDAEDTTADTTAPQSQSGSPLGGCRGGLAGFVPALAVAVAAGTAIIIKRK